MGHAEISLFKIVRGIIRLQVTNVRVAWNAGRRVGVYVGPVPICTSSYGVRTRKKLIPTFAVPSDSKDAIRQRRVLSVVRLEWSAVRGLWWKLLNSFVQAKRLSGWPVNSRRPQMRTVTHVVVPVVLVATRGAPLNRGREGGSPQPFFKHEAPTIASL